MDKKILVDWLTFTVGTVCFLRDFGYPDSYSNSREDEIISATFHSDESILRQLKRFLGLPNDMEFRILNGIYGYEKRFICGGIRFCWGGNCDTIMIDLTGEGCRLLESTSKNLEWLQLLKSVSRFQRHNFSRLDVACDVINGLSMDFIFQYSEEGRYISRWKSRPRVVKCREETIDFGSPKSRTMLRIYNKTLERKCKVDKDIEVPEGWIRLELEMRDKAVDSFVREWIACEDISKVYFGFMANQLVFVKKRETNLERSVTVKWWRDFLDNSKPIRLAYQGGLEYNLDSLQRYVYGQAGSSIKTLLMFSDWDVEEMIKVIKPKKCNSRQTSLLSRADAIKAAKKDVRKRLGKLRSV